MQLPPYLKAGDRIHMISTARKVDPEAIIKATSYFEQHGLVISHGKSLFSEENQYAGSDEQRLFDLQQALDNPHISAILCAKGGYGTSRILDRLDWRGFLMNPKWICGFSDITALLNMAQQKGVASLHSCMPGQFDAHPDRLESFESLRAALLGLPIRLETPIHAFNREGQAKGHLIGGNLSILAHCIDTASDPHYEGAILFLEDLDEYLYHIDRMMVQLKRSGRLAKLAGLVIGQFSDMRDNAVPFGTTAYEIIREHVAEYSYPVGYGFPIGHEIINKAIPVGPQANLVVGLEESKLYLS